MSWTATSDGDTGTHTWANKIENALGSGFPAQPATYTIIHDSAGSEYEARYGLDGTIDYSGASLATVTQSVVDQLASLGGGSLFYLLHGSHTFSATVTMPRGSDKAIKIHGTGFGTTLTRDGTHALFTFSVSGSDRPRDVIMKDLCLDEGGQTGYLLNFTRGDRIRLQNLRFQMDTAGAQGIYGEHTWDVWVNNCLFVNGGNGAATPIVKLYNGASNNCNNWWFTNCRFERTETYNSYAIISDGTGAGTDNQNINVIGCKIHGASDSGFTSGAIQYKTTKRSRIALNWITHHLGKVIEVDENCYNVKVVDNEFLTQAGQGTPTCWVAVDGTHCDVRGVTGEGSPTQMVLLDANSANCHVAVGSLVSYTASITKLTDNGAATNYGFKKLIVPFVDGTTWDDNGWDVDANTEYAATFFKLPEDFHELVDIKIWAYSVVTEADAMRLEITGNGGGDNEAYNTEAIAIADKASTSTNFAANDIIYWTLTSSDDADLGHLAAGDSVTLKVLHEAAGGDDCATDARLRNIEITYM